MILRFEYNTATLVFVGSGQHANVLGVEWKPNAGDYNDEFVEEKILVKASGTSAQLHALRKSINLYLTKAKTRSNHITGYRIYLEAQLDGATEVSRSEIIEGQSTWEGKNPTGWVTAGIATIRITLLRRNYWEDGQVTLKLSNVHGTDVTTGLTVDNVYSAASKEFWVEIDGVNDVTGELPTPAKIEMKNTYNNATRNTNVYIAHNVESSPTTLIPIIEGEDSIISNLSFTASADASASGGFVGQWTWSGANTANGLLAARWDLTSAFIGKYFGNNTKIIMLMPNISSGVYFRFEIEFALTKIWESSWIHSQNVYGGVSDVLELTSVQIPPFLYSDFSETIYPLTFTMYVRDDDGGSKNLTIDYFAFLPIDSFRPMKSRGYGFAYNVSLIDDPILNQTYTTGWSTAGIVGNYVPFGSPVMLIPGRNQTTYFLWDDGLGNYVTARTMAIKMYYRPRRLML